MKKSAFGLLLTTLMIASSIFVGFSQFALAQSSGTSFSGIIATDTTWTQANSPYTLIGNALVSSGATLTIQPGVTVNLGSYYMMVNGTLQAVGSSSSPVTFNANSNMYMYGSNVGQLIFTQFCNGWNSASSTGCELVGSVINCSLTVSNSVKIEQNKVYMGVSVQSQINAIQTGTPVISNNLIQGGITIGNALGSAIIANNTITSGGISFGSMNAPTVTITGNRISGCSAAVSVGCWGGWNNAVQNIQNNLIVNNSIGIQINVYESDKGPYITGNTITNNSIGIQVAYSMGNNSPILNSTIANNNIYGNTNYNFKNNVPTTITATNNWWGTTDTQAISQAIYDFYDDFTIGVVTYNPFLTAPDNGGPTYNPVPTPTPTPTNNVTATPTPIPTASPPPTPTPTQRNTSQTTTMPITNDKGAIVNVAMNGNISISQISNVIIATNQSATITVLSFTLTGQSGTIGFSNLTIAKSEVPYGKIPVIYIDGQLAENQGYMQDDNNYYVWYTTHFSTHEISIVFASGSNLAPEPVQSQPNYMAIIYGVIAGAAIVTAIVVSLILLTRSKKAK